MSSRHEEYDQIIVINSDAHISTGDTLELSVNDTLCKNKTRTLQNKTPLQTTREVFNQAQLQCIACEFRASKNYELNLHVAQNHTEHYPCVCAECGIIFHTKESLAEHLLVHSNMDVEVSQHTQFLGSDGKNSKLQQGVVSKKHSLKLRTDAIRFSTLERAHSVNGMLKCALCTYSCSNNKCLTAHIRTEHSDVKPFTCKFCDRKFKRRCTLIRHVSTHTLSKPHKCSQCSFSCNRGDNMKVHMVTIHKNDPLKCPECDYTCKLPIYLKFHKLTHTETSPLSCLKCNYEFKTIENLQLDESEGSLNCPNCSRLLVFESYKSLLPDSLNLFDGALYRCDICKFECKRKTSLESHKAFHSENGIFNCPVCNTQLDNMPSLKRHILKHRTGGFLICSLCEYSTKSLESFGIHVRASHLKMDDKNYIKVDIRSKDKFDSPLTVQLEVNAENYVNKLQLMQGSQSFQSKFKSSEKAAFDKNPLFDENNTLNPDEIPIKDVKYNEYTIKCNVDTQYSFTSASVEHTIMDLKSTFDKQTSTKSAETFANNLQKVHQCPKCVLTFKRKGDLTQHLNKSHPDYKNFKCTFCPQLFKHKSHLKQHYAVHSTDRPYSCPLCESTFKLKETLNRHLVIHSAKKPFKCELCTYSCKLKEKLKSHVLVHSLERPYQCMKCSYDCKSRELLKKHAVVHSRTKK